MIFNLKRGRGGMLISQLRCVPVCFYCSISLCRCQYFVVLVCFRRQMVGADASVRYSGGTAGTANSWCSSTRIMGWVRASAQASISSKAQRWRLARYGPPSSKNSFACNVVRVVGDVYIAAPVGRAQPVGANIGHIVQYRPVIQPITGCRAVGCFAKRTSSRRRGFSSRSAR